MDSSSIRVASSHNAESVQLVAMAVLGASARASGSSSANTIHTMHPAAKPRATGRTPVKAETKR